MALRRPPATLQEADFDSFVEASRHVVLGSLRILTRDASAAEDAAQEAYFRAYKRWAKVSRLENPTLWVLRVASNVAVSEWRKGKREVKTEFRFEIGSERDLVTEAWVRWGLAGLSMSQRALLILHHVEGRPLEELASESGVSENATKQSLYRARLRLRHRLAGGARE